MPEGYGASGLLTGPDTESATGENTGGQSSGVDVPPQDAQPMASSQFDALKSQVADEGMSNNKIALVEEAGKSSYFSAAQVGELAALLDMKDQRVKLVGAVAHRILDLNNPGAITSKLTFADERSDVEAIMSDAQAARGQEEARLAEAARVAEEKRVADEAKAAEQARLKQEAEAAKTTTSPSSTTTTSSSNSSYCCLNGKYNACDSAAAAGACMGWGKCFFDCQMNGGSSCDETCADKYPLISECRADASRDNQCNQ